MNNKTSRKDSALQTKSVIQSTVVKMMKQVSFDKLTIRDICKEANVSTGTFYTYFPSKEHALLFSHRYIDNLYVDFDFSGCSNAIEKIQKIISVYLKSIEQEDFEYIQQIYIAHIKCYYKDMFTDSRVLAGLITSIIDEGKNDNLIYSNEDSHRLTQCLMRAARGHVYDYCINPNKRDAQKWLVDAQKDMHSYIEFFLKNK